MDMTELPEEHIKEFQDLKKQLFEEVQKRESCEKILQKKENLFNSFLENLNTALALIDESGKYVLFNQAFLKLFGLSKESTIKDLNDQDWSKWHIFNTNFEKLHVDEHPVRKALITGKPVKDQLIGVILPSQSDLKWMLVSAKPLFTEKGEIDSIICTYNDITESKLTEAKLLKSEQALSSLYDSMREGFVVYETIYNNAFKAIDYMITEINPAYEEISGLKKSGIIGKKLSELYSLESKQFSDLFEKISASGMSESFESYFSSIRKYLKITAFSSTEGKFLTVIEDISERKKDEDALRQSEARFRSVLDNSKDVIYSMNMQTGKYQYISPSFHALFGYTEEEMEAINENTAISLVHPDDVPVITDRFNLIHKTGKVELQFRVRCKNGEYRWVSDHTSTVKDKEGRHVLRNGNIRDITEQKRAEIELLISQERFRTAFEDGAIAMSITSIEGTLLSVNNAFCELTGYTKSELKCLRFQDFTHPDDLEINIRELNRLTRGEISSFRMEKRYIRKDGNIIWGEISAAGVKNQDGRIDYMITQIQNINERKKAEIELRKNEEKYKELVDNARSIIIKLDRSGLISFFNEYAQKIFGFTEEEILGKTAYGTIVPEIGLQGHQMNQMLEKIYKDPDKYEVNINENIKKNGERLIIEWHNRALYDDNGERTGHLAVGVDITSRLKAEQELKESKEKLDVAMDIGHIGIWEWDLTRNLVFCDERIEKMMNCQIGSKIHEYHDFENCIDEEDLPHFRKAIQEAFKENLSLETVFRTKPINGEARFISTKSLITRNKSGKPVAMTCVCFDVTGMKKGTERALINLNEELLRSNKDLHQFAYVASHDLQEPLRMVSSFTQMLQHRYGDKLDSDANEYIKFAVDGSKRMYQLINGLLAYSRVQTKGKEFGKVKMDTVVEKVIANLSFMIEERKATINIRKLPVIFADENQMIQLLQNLIENGLKFSIERPVISISSRRENGHYIFSVKDTGIGIEPQYHDRIFQIFQRLNKRNEYDGTGIGLAICKRIVERHNGRIWLESFPGRGCTFSFSIPKKQIMYTA